MRLRGTCAETRELLGAHVLGALEADDCAAVERHLAVCPDCAAEHDGLAGLLPLLDVAADEVPPPPPALEEALLDSLARERGAPAGAEAAGRHGSAPRLGFRLPRIALLGGGLAAGMAVLVIGLVLALGGGAGGGGAGGGPSSALPPAPAPGAQAFVVDLRGDGAATGRAALRARPGGTSVALEGHGLPPDAVLEMECVKDDGESLPAGTFRTDASGRVDVALTTAARSGEYHLLRIMRRDRGGGVMLAGTIPSGGSARPY